jgi:DNA-binding MarR family transcriptional regulator
MHRPEDLIGPALIELTGFINDPRNDGHVMAEAGLNIDPMFMPLLVRLGALGEAGVVQLADVVGRDHSTISRQLAKLQAAGLVERPASHTDGRVHVARLTPRGQVATASLRDARRRLLQGVLTDWTAQEREALAVLLPRFAKALSDAVKTTP